MHDKTTSLDDGTEYAAGYTLFRVIAMGWLVLAVAGAVLGLLVFPLLTSFGILR
jgi:hypothetical protein